MAGIFSAITGDAPGPGDDFPEDDAVVGTGEEAYPAPDNPGDPSPKQPDDPTAGDDGGFSA